MCSCGRVGLPAGLTSPRFLRLFEAEHWGTEGQQSVSTQ